jgi:hypothetical protein
MNRRWTTRGLPALLLCLAAPAAEPGKAAAGQKVELTVEEETARAQCANNIMRLIENCHAWAGFRVGVKGFPPGVEDLSPPDILLVCPAVQEHRPGAGKVEHCDYVYIPGSTPAGAKHVVLFCPKANHGGKFRVVAYSCGAVSSEDSDAKFRKALKETLKELKVSLDPPKAPEPKALSAEEQAKLKAALAELASEEFETRDKASRTLAAAGEAARPVLEQGARAEDVETQSRCKRLLNALAKAQARGAWLAAVRRELGLDPPARLQPPRKQE